MKTAFSLACIAILGAQAISVNQANGNGQDPQEEDPMMMTTYIGFEFEGAQLAE